MKGREETKTHYLDGFGQKWFFVNTVSRINGWIILIFAHRSTINIYERKSQKFPFRREFSLNVCLGMAISHVDWMIP